MPFSLILAKIKNKRFCSCSVIFARIKEKGIDNVINLYANDFKINEKLSNSREYLTENINSL
ncbi:hypothetical protein VWM73_12535, partial [Campylobacter coli]